MFRNAVNTYDSYLVDSGRYEIRRMKLYQIRKYAKLKVKRNIIPTKFMNIKHDLTFSNVTQN